MSCSNCYNGCPQIVSDQCVKYTGVDVAILGIQTGDSLSYVEQALITFLTSTLDGTGIKVNIDSNILCPIVNQYLIQCEDLNVDNLFETLIKVACDLQSQITVIQGNVTNIQSTLTTLNANYDIKCLTGVTNSSDTHDILQAVVDRLCQFITDVGVTYVKIADINTYIANYLNTNGVPPPQFYRQNMVPYVAYEYYGPLVDPLDPGTGFVGGIGAGKWTKVYLCNGQNGTPDKRGRVAVGVTDGTMGGGIMSPAVNPSLINPNYSVFSAFGSNGVILSTNQIPPHTHSANSVVTDPGHTHGYDSVTQPSGAGEGSRKSVPIAGTTQSSVTGITVQTTVANTGGGEAHANNQPAIGAYYIMYIP
jgi:microcystin-dependent protein